MSNETKDIVAEVPMSARFTNSIIAEFSSSAGDATVFGPEQRRLAQHLFIKVDQQLKTLEAKRVDKGMTKKTPILWSNINMQKLALDAFHRIELGLDALIPNHIHPVPYMNSSIGKYDLDLRVGYAGKAYYRQAVAVGDLIDVRYELVYSTDKFVPIKKGGGNAIEGYEFEIKQPFNRGEILGGFGYISYTNPEKNILVIVTEADFVRSEKKAQDETFWKGHPVEMRYKTLIHRVTDKLQIDPKKISASYSAVEEDPGVIGAEAALDETLGAEANSGPIIDVVPEPAEEKTTEPPAAAEEPKAKEEPKKKPAGLSRAVQVRLDGYKEEVGALISIKAVDEFFKKNHKALLDELGEEGLDVLAVFGNEHIEEIKRINVVEKAEATGTNGPTY